MQPLYIISSGMITGVGLNTAASCAAIRTGINNFQETRFLDSSGEWIIGSMVPLEPPLRGETKLLHFAVSVIKECLEEVKQIPTGSIALLLCLVEKERPGRLPGLENEFLEEIQQTLGLKFHKESKIFNMGRVSGVYAINTARQLLTYSDIKYCLLVGVDSLLVAPTLSAFEENDFLLTSKNSDGFVPGEAGAAVFIGTSDYNKKGIKILSTGFGNEKATIISEEPLKADGLVLAINNALKNCSLQLNDIDFRITDANGKQYYFKEAALARLRILRGRKEEFNIWNPVDCVGETGAAIVTIVLGLAFEAAKKKYLLGERILCHFGNDNGERAALILEEIT